MINFESPLFINILLYAIYALLVLAVGLALWSAFRSMRRQGTGEKRSNGIPSRIILIATVCLLIGALVLTYLLADTHPLLINGKPFADVFWLRTSDMLINTSIFLIAVAGIGTALGLLGIGRKLKR